MAITLVNRYKQLLSTVPKGSFYESDGQVLPFRGESPYELRITTGVPNRQYGVFINDQYSTLITTNASSIALITTKLAKGRNDIRLMDAVTQSPTIAYITTREYATVFAAEAEVLEDLDEGIEQVLLDSKLATSSIGLIETVFGKTVETGNNFGLDLDTYRELLSEIRIAYRYWGGTVEGLARIVRAFTQVSPLIYPSGFGPTWILGKDIISPKHSTTNRAYYTTSVLTNLNAGGAGVSISSISNTVGVGTGTLESNSYLFGTLKTMTWTPPNGLEGPEVPVFSNIPVTLYGLDYFDPIIGFPGTYNIVTGANDIISLDIDGKGIIDITLTAGAARTATQIATDINTALVADLRYGAGYSAVADSYDSFGSGAPMIRLTTPTGATNGSIKLMPRFGVDATQTLFNTPIIRGGLSANYGIGVTSIVLSASTDMSSWPSPTTSDPLKVILGGTTFHPTGAPNAAIVTTAAELVSVTNVDDGTKTLTLALPTTIAHNQNEVAYVQDEWPYIRENVKNSRSIVVNATNHLLLPGITTTDSVVVNGTGAPNGWVVTTNAGAPVSPTSFVKHSYFSLDRDVPFDLNANGMVTIPIPDEILNYKGFDVNVIFWGRIDDPSRAATQSTINSIDVSFDNQTSYSSTAPTVTGLAVNAQWRPQEYIRTVRVPPTATKMWIRAKLSAAGVGNFTIHKVRITVPSAHGGLYLGDGTTPRAEGKIKHGNFLYCWCVDPLTASEDTSLGLTNVTQVNPGHIDKIAPSEAWLEKFDISEYSGSTAMNVKGVFNETDFLNGIATNTELVLRTPARFSYMKPSLVSDTTQTVQFNPSPAHVAALTIASDEDASTSILLQDGVPLTKDQWQYNSNTEIELLSTPSSTSVYSFLYKALIRFESGIIDLGATFTDYLWMADYHTWLRPEIEPILAVISTGIQFDASGIATLDELSTQDKSVATLIEDTGLTQRIIPISQWNFIDSRRIQIDLDIVNTNGLYEFKYTSEVNHPSTLASVKVELRSAASSGTVTAATYGEVFHNTVIDGSLRYHQMRITLSNIRDLRDARVQSLVIKGLNMFGSGGSVPILRP